MPPDLRASDREVRDGALPGSEAQALLGLARGWSRRNHPDRAAAYLRRVVELDPDLQGAYVELARVLANQRRWHDTIEACEVGLARFPHREVLHKLLVKSINELHGHDAVLDRYRLERIDGRQIDTPQGDVLGCLVLRNERDRLPWHLAAHRALGVSTFLVVDNGSTDGSLEYLLDQPDVRLWRTTMSFRQGNFGSAWFEALLSRYGVGRWVLMLDADEIFRFPGDRHVGLRELCHQLDGRGYRAVSGTLLDMYSSRPVADTPYRAGEDFLQVCPYFDRRSYHDEQPNAGVFANQTLRFGGVRSRVFGSDTRFLVTKTPLLRYDPDVVLAGGQHWTSHPADRIAHDGGVVLHFKFFSSFVQYAQDEAGRNEHAEGAGQYKTYASRIREEAAVVLYDEAESVKFESPDQLLELGLIDQTWLGADPWASTPPVIAQREPAAAARQWSVMITVYRRVHTLERAIRSVLAAANDEMQIAVVADHSDEATHRRIEAIIDVINGPGRRVELQILPQPAGHPNVFNRAIDLAQGDWVHILHDDDAVQPDFYEAIEDGLANHDSIGSAFTRHVIASGAGRRTTSWLERETAGVIDDWSDRIALECRTQFSPVVVRRAVYEEVGGFLPGIGSAFDWEMWQRIAGRHKIWFDPRPLVVVARDGTAETDRLVTNGEQIRDAVAAIERGNVGSSSTRAGRLARRARVQFARRGVDLASAQIAAGLHEGALRNIASALEADDSPEVLDALRRTLEEHLGTHPERFDNGVEVGDDR